MTTQPDLSRGGQPGVEQLYALLAGICAAVEGEVVVPDRALMAANGRALHIWRDDRDGCIRLKLADDVPTGPSSALPAWEDTFVGGVPPEPAGG